MGINRAVLWIDDEEYGGFDHVGAEPHQRRQQWARAVQRQPGLLDQVVREHIDALPVFVAAIEAEALMRAEDNPRRFDPRGPRSGPNSKRNLIQGHLLSPDLPAIPRRSSGCGTLGGSGGWRRP